MIIFNLIILTLCILNIYTFISLESIWGIIDEMVAIPFVPITSVFMALTLIIFLLSLINLVFALKNKQQQESPVKKHFFKEITLTSISLALTATIIYIFIELGGSRNRIFEYMRADFQFIIKILPFVLTIFLIVCHKKLSAKAYAILKIVAISAIIIFFSHLAYMKFEPLKITSGPIVQAISENSVAIIWSTNKKSTGYVEYGLDKSSMTKAYSTRDGLVDANTKYHKIVIPTKLDNKNSDSTFYRIASTELKHLYDGEVKYGKTLLSEIKEIPDLREDNITFYVMNDVHELDGIYKQFLSRNDYQFAVLNGDAVNSIESLEGFCKKFTKPLGQSTQGSKPFLFVRGNHETRGNAARDLENLLVLPDGRFYYTYSFGTVFSIVMDWGEDKPDNDISNAGLTAFEDYREEQLNWLKKVCNTEQFKNAKYKIGFIHAPLNNEDGNEWAEYLSSSGMDIIFAGHTHKPEIIQPTQKVKYPTIIGGSDHDEKSFQAVKAEIRSNGLKVYYVDYYGNEKDIYTITK